MSVYSQTYMILPPQLSEHCRTSIRLSLTLPRYSEHNLNKTKTKRKRQQTYLPGYQPTNLALARGRKASRCSALYYYSTSSPSYHQ